MSGYTPQLLDHFQSPRNVGILKDADGIGTAGKPGEGHFLVMYVKVKEGRLVEISFQTFGCAAAIACGSYVTERSRGLSVDEALRIPESEVSTGLGGLPLGKRTYAGMALGALRLAIEDCLAKQSLNAGTDSAPKASSEKL